MLVSEANGLPVAFLLEAANTYESQLTRDGLANVKVPLSLSVSAMENADSVVLTPSSTM